MEVLPQLTTKDRIKAHLEQRIVRDWPPGTRLPALRQLAQELNVGDRNLFLAVQELVAQGVLESRPRKGTVVKARPAVPGSGAAGWSATESSTPAMTMPDHIQIVDLVPHEPFVQAMIEGFRDALSDLEIRLAVTRPEPSNTAGVHRLMLSIAEMPHEALAIFNPLPVQGFACRADQKMVVVTTGANPFVAMGQGYDVVSVDQEQGGFLAGERLATLGVKDVCFIGVHRLRSHSYDTTSAARLMGLERGLGVGVLEEHQLMAQFYDPSCAGKLVPDYLRMSPRPRAIFCASDELALGFISGAAAHGLTPGVDFQIIGFDGQEAGKRLALGSLSTIEIPSRAMGRMGARLLLERFGRPEQPARRVLLGCSLIEGKTAVMPGSS